MHLDQQENRLVFDHLRDVHRSFDVDEAYSIPFFDKASRLDELEGIHARARIAAEQIRSVLLAA